MLKTASYSMVEATTMRPSLEECRVQCHARVCLNSCLVYRGVLYIYTPVIYIIYTIYTCELPEAGERVALLMMASISGSMG